MWGRKKLDRSRTADSETRSLHGSQPSKAAPVLREQAATVNNGGMRPAAATTNPASSWVGLGLRVKGEISGDEDLLIDGSVEGLVQLDDRNLTVGASAKMAADIIAGEVVIFGELKGNVRAKARIEIKKEGSVTGDLTTPQILIEDGAFFKGTIEIEKSSENDSRKNAFPPAA